MAKKDGGYPMKSPRNRTHGLAAMAIDQVDLVVEPFLIVALIAGVRRLLLVTAQLATNPTDFSWSHQGIEMTVLLALILGITLALVLWHRFHIQSVASKA